MDLDMMPAILDINKVPWFKPKGIADAVHQYKNGKKQITYPVTGTLEKLPGVLEEIFGEMDKEK